MESRREPLAPEAARSPQRVEAPAPEAAILAASGNAAVTRFLVQRQADAPAARSAWPLSDLSRMGGNTAVTRLLVQRQADAPAPAPAPAPAAPAGPDMNPGNGTTAELRAERARLQGELDHLHVSTIEPETELLYNRYVRSIARLDVLLAERGDSALPDAGVTLTFDGTTLTMSGVGSWPAVSGRPDASGGFDNSPSRQHLEGVGPIPAGQYWLDPTQLVDLRDRWFYSWRYESAWGTHRITIHPSDSTQTFGRGGFFIHGGTTPGSAGCIDLTGSMAAFAKKLGALPPGVKVTLVVRYPPAP